MSGSFKVTTRVKPKAGIPAELLESINAKGQLSGDGGREGAGEGSRGLSSRTAPGRQEVLRDERQRRSCSGLSPEGMGRDRAKAREEVVLQSGQAKVPGTNQLLRASGRGGWTGAHLNSTRLAGIRADEGRSGRAGKPHVPANLESRAIPRAVEP